MVNYKTGDFVQFKDPFQDKYYMEFFYTYDKKQQARIIKDHGKGPYYVLDDAGRGDHSAPILSRVSDGEILDGYYGYRFEKLIATIQDD